VETFLVIWLVTSVIFGVIASTFAPGKNRSQLAFFLCGFLLGLIGLLICAFAPSDAPKGMQVFKCPRCNTKQNVPATATKAECWQCHYVAKSTDAPKSFNIATGLRK
jgi:MFS family permease